MRGRFDRGGIRFSYRDEGEGPALVLQHGLGGDCSQPGLLWDGAGRLVCLECRGHGATTPLGPLGALGFEAFALDLAALLDRLEIESAVLGGISMGAGVAARLAWEQPHRARGLIMIRPAWFDERLPENLAGHVEAGELLLEHGAGAKRALAGERRTLGRERTPAEARAMLAQLDRPHAVEHAAVLTRLPADLPLPTPPPWPQLAMPALVVATPSDAAHPVECARLWCSALPHAELAMVTAKAVDEEAHRREVGAAVSSFLAARAAGP